MKKKCPGLKACLLAFSVLFLMTGCEYSNTNQHKLKLSDQQVEEIMRLSCRFVAMYNVNNKFALRPGGWNTVDPDTKAQGPDDAGDWAAQ